MELKSGGEPPHSKKGDFASQVGDGEGGEVGEGKNSSGGEAREFRDSSEEREDCDAVESYGVTSFSGRKEMEFGDSGEKFLCVFA
jgi:hypothetical protein